MRLFAAAVLAAMTLAVAPATAGAVSVTDPAGDSTCGAGCVDLVSVEEVRAGQLMRFTFTSAAPWGSAMPELRIWTTSPDSAHFDMSVTGYGNVFTVTQCADWTNHSGCFGGDEYPAERPSATTVIYEVSIGRNHRWQAAAGHGGLFPDPQPFDVAPDGAPVAGVALPDGDGDGLPDIHDACPDDAGPASGDGCPAYVPKDAPFFGLYHCPTGGTRTFAYAFRPGGGGAPAEGGSAVHPFDDHTDAVDGPSFAVSTPDGTWRAWIGVHAFLTPSARPHCRIAGPYQPITKRPRHRVSTTRAADLRCRFQSKFGYLAVFGISGAAPARARRVVAHDFVIRHGVHRHNQRTLLSARLSGAKPKLTYDAKACVRLDAG